MIFPLMVRKKNTVCSLVSGQVGDNLPAFIFVFLFLVLLFC